MKVSGTANTNVLNLHLSRVQSSMFYIEIHDSNPIGLHKQDYGNHEQAAQ